MDEVEVIVVGLGPGDERYLTASSVDLIRTAHVARLRTRQHPAAAAFGDLVSYDELYEHATSFDELYGDIVDDLVTLARNAPDHRVLYLVPGSPVVAERTVELLRERDDVTVRCEPALSIIEMACAAVGRDPLAVGLRVVDALGDVVALRGRGEMLVLQTYCPEVLAVIGDQLDPDTEVIVLHHLGSSDEQVRHMRAGELKHFGTADHLTSLWVGERRSAGTALEDLVELTAELRERCVWDQEQSHGSLTRHLLEEAYETFDALERYVAAGGDEPEGTSDASEVIEELGDLLFQIVFHAQLGHESERFDAVSIADSVRTKLVARHPHVFGDAVVDDADDAARQWEQLKVAEKNRTSVTDGVPLQLPSLALYSALGRKASALDMEGEGADVLVDRARELLLAIIVESDSTADTQRDEHGDATWATLMGTLGDLAGQCGIDLEAVMRGRALALRDAIVAREQEKTSTLPE